MSDTRDITLILDNRGGAMLQIVDGGHRYQHYYDDASDCGRDYMSAADGSDIDDWAGNEYTADDSLHGQTGPDGQTYSPWMQPTYEDIRNGRYRVCRDLMDVVDAAADGWCNAQMIIDGMIATAGGGRYIVDLVLDQRRAAAIGA